jgi:hypothetical protein
MNSLSLNTRDTAHWRALVAAAEASVQSCLDDDLENYVVMLLLRFADSGRNKQSAPTADVSTPESLIEVGDRCLIIAGLMPDQALAQGLPIHHFVQTGRHAYEEAARRCENVLFRRLAARFVTIMDVLQVMRTLDDDEIVVDMFRVYDQWQETGSQYAFRLLRAATDALPVRHYSQQRH